VTDVENLHSLGSFDDSIDHAIYVRLAPTEKVTQLLVLRSPRASVGKAFKRQDRLL